MKNLLYFAMFLPFCLNAQIDVTTGIKVCMPFNGNANDLSGNGNNGSVSGATLTTDRMGVANKAYQFNRVNNSNIAISSFAALAPTNELTISMWAKCDQSTSNCLFALSPDKASDRCVGCAQYVNNPTMMIWDYGSISGGRSVVESIPVDLSNWHHYVFMVSQAGNFKKMYLDGIENFTSAYTLSCSNKNLPFFIGGGFSDTTSSKIMWQGKIDEVYIYNRALSPADVSALFSGTSVCSGGNVGLESLKAIEDLWVYQNNGSALWTIRSNKMNPASRVQIFGLDGKLLMESAGANLEMQIDATGLQPGLYLLKLTEGTHVYQRKVIKN